MNLSPLPRLIFAIALPALAAGPAPAQVPRDRAVELRAIIRQAPPRITLQWNSPAQTTLLSQQIFRRSTHTAPWTELANLPVTATLYVDNAVTVGTRYEYFVHRVYQGSPGSASGWLSAGIRAPLLAERGRIILLVDDTMAAPLATELAQFTRDLMGDGWGVVRQDISRSATVPSVRAVVQSIRNADPAKTVALILFGHIPVPYSGDYATDGHDDHIGAWPTDTYYGDVDGTWTDTTVNDTRASQPRQHNVPGDGKFDQSFLPSDVDLAVGRIDLAAMPAFALSETELLRQYLVRDHRYRHRLGAFAAIPRRALIDDHFGFFDGEAFAATGWRSFPPLFGSANVRTLDWFTTLQTQKYLCAYGCGAGWFTGADGIGSTNDFAARSSQAVFNFLLGSYFGEWDNQDNFLRAPLAGTAASFGLVSAFAGRPHWYLHPMGLGETIGFCARLAQNNQASFPGGYEANGTDRGIHITLLGDPTLRLHPVKPPTNLIARPGAAGIALTWRAAADFPVEGYIIDRATSPLGPFVRLRGAVKAEVSFVDRAATPGVSYTYLVRAVKRELTTSGSYLNPSQGVFSAPVTARAGTGPEIDIEGRGQSLTDGDTVPLESNDTAFGAVQIGQPAVTHTFTIWNPGTTTLTIISTLRSGPHAADFLLTGVPPSVPAGGAATFQVSFQPTAPGTRTAKLTLRTNDANETLFDFTMGGSAIAP